MNDLEIDTEASDLTTQKDTPSLLSKVMLETPRSRAYGIYPAKLFKLNKSSVWVECTELMESVVLAKSLVPLQSHHKGAACMIMFEEGLTTKPVIMGLVQTSFMDAHDPLVIGSDQGVVIQSGESKITLRPDGDIAIQGERVTSRAYTTNKIQGGSVKIN